MRSNAGARLDRLPMSSFHHRLIWLIGLGIFFDTFDLSLMSGVLGAVMAKHWSTLQLNGLFISSTFLGMAIGAFLCGILGDRFGRRFTYQFNLLVFGLASIAAAFAPSMIVLIVIRGIMGIGLGAEYVAGYSLLTEFIPPSVRGRYIAIVGIVSMAAGTVTAFIGYVVIPALGWQAMFVIGGIGALVVWYLRKKLPESPRWLESVGRTQEADDVISHIEAEIATGGVTLAPVPPGPPIAPSNANLGTLFAPGIRQRTLMIMFLNVVMGAANYGFVTWIPTFLVQQGMDVSKSLGYSAVMSIGGICGPLLAFWIADRVGRKPAIVATCIVAAVIGLCYGFVHDEVALLACGFLMIGSILLLLTLGISIYGPELFATDYRMRANGVGQAFGRLVTVFIPFAVVALFSGYGVLGVVGTLSALLVLAAIVVAVWGVETRHRSLEAIADDVGQPSVSTVPVAPRA